MRTFVSIVKSHKALSTAIRRGAYIRSQKHQAKLARHHNIIHQGSMRGIGQGQCWGALSILDLHHRRSQLIRGQRIRHQGLQALCHGIYVSLCRKKVELLMTSNDQVIHWWATQASSQSTKVKINLSTYQNPLTSVQMGNTCQAILES